MKEKNPFNLILLNFYYVFWFMGGIILPQMRTIENHQPIQNFLTEKDFHVPVVADRSSGKSSKEQAFCLYDVFSDIENSETEKIAMKIIDRMKLSSDDSTVLYFYHLWSEDPRRVFIRIKKLVGEIREDKIERVVNKVNENDLLAEQYSYFYKRYIRATEKFRRGDLISSIRENIFIEEAAQESEIKLNNAIAVKAQIDKKPKDITLEESLKEKELSTKETRALQATDILNIALVDKKVLLGAYIFFESGIFRTKKLLDFTVNQAVGARDKVRTNDRYEKFWKKFLFLLKLNYIEVAILKKRKIPHLQISEILGVSINEVNRISKDLIASEIINPSLRGKTQATVFQDFCKKVEMIENPSLSDEEIAITLNSNAGRVKRARRRLRLEGKTRQRTPKEVRQIYSKRFLPLRKEVKKLTLEGRNIREISQETGATPIQIKHQRRILLRMGEIPLIRY